MHPPTGTRETQDNNIVPLQESKKPDGQEQTTERAGKNYIRHAASPRQLGKHETNHDEGNIQSYETCASVHSMG
jgi:hypothetical protein